MRNCAVRELGNIEYGEAFRLQQRLVEQRKQGLIPDQFLIVEHPHTVTLGRNGRKEHLLADEATLRGAGISFYPTDRGGDVTYHGPGQVVGYPILDLREWKRDVVAYVRAVEQILIDSMREFGLDAGRVPGWTGVWVHGRKIAAIGVHISRWITSHGFALNVTTDLSYFRYIVPCGLAQPVTSMRELGVGSDRPEVVASLVRHFAATFECEIISAATEMERVL
jgi:lipoyl(octanoyl) transferase